jgi:hypothetical protein
MRDSDKKELVECVETCAIDVCSSCGIAVDACSDGPSSQNTASSIVAMVGYAGPVMRGTLTIVAPQRLVRACYPVSAESVGLHELFDWWGEVANQFLGRVKNKLVGRGVEIHQSTPKSLLADQLRFLVSDQSISVFEVASGDDRIGVWFDAESNGSAALFTASPSVAPAPAAAEGEMFLF